MPGPPTDMQALLRAFVDATPHRMGILQLEGDDYRYLVANPACAGSLPHVEGQRVEGRLARELAVPEERRRLVLTLARETVARAAPVHSTVRDVGVDPDRVFAATFVQLPGEAALPRVAFVAVDVTDQQRAEARLIDSEDRYRSLFATIPDAVCVMDADSARLLEVNAAFLKQYGYTAEEAALLKAWDISNEPEKTRKTLEDARREGVAMTALRWHRRKDGTIFPVETRTTLFRHRGRDLLCAVLRDITERRSMEAQLIVADRMATVGTLAAGVAHEINNPLSYVLANLSWTDEELGRRAAALSAAGVDAPEVLHALCEALQGAARVRDIVRDLKTFSQQGGGARVRVDVRRPIEAALRMAMNEIRHRASLVRELDDVPLVEGDEAHLAQVFLNLLTNAVQALPERAVDQNQIRVAARALGSSEVEVSVTDNGRGMSESEIARIFDPFFTTRPIGEGQGLGLSVCLGIVRGLGGRIEVESEPGVGSKFRVVLPRAAEAEAEPPTRAAAALLRRPRVLVVDDEPLVVRSTARMLAADHDVVAEIDPRAALERLRRGEKFDAILCDIMMPQLSGMDFYEELCRVRPDLCDHTAFLTGGAFTPRARQFVESRPGLSLEKPFEAEALKALIARLVATAPARR